MREVDQLITAGMNCFLTALIFLSSTFMDHLLCVGSFSADVVPTSHKAAEVGEYTDTVKVEVTRVLIGVFIHYIRDSRPLSWA